MFAINKYLIDRKEDASFFDTAKFRVFRCNLNAYKILSSFKDNTFSLQDFLDKCWEFKTEASSARNFFDKCRQNEIVVEASY